MIQPAQHECHACCPLQAEKPGIQPIVGNTHDTRVEQVVSSFQKILRGSQLTWYLRTVLYLLQPYLLDITSRHVTFEYSDFYFSEICVGKPIHSSTNDLALVWSVLPTKITRNKKSLNSSVTRYIRESI